MILRLLFALLGALSLVGASSTSRGPLQFLGTVEDVTIHSQRRRVHARSAFDLTLDLFHGLRRVKLSLEPNHDIIPDGATITHLHADGSVRSQEPILREEHKVYRGSAYLQVDEDVWIHTGWARITMLRDGVWPLFEGAFSVNHDNHHIQLSSHYMDSRHSMDPEVELEHDEYMVVWRDSDIAPDGNLASLRRDLEGPSCSFGESPFNTNPQHPVHDMLLRRDLDSTWGEMPVGNLFGKRQIDTQGNGNSAGVNLVQSIGQTQGCPSTRKVALVGVATDCTYTGTFNASETARQNIITQMNSASSLYESSFNISLGLQNLTISDANCPGSAPTGPTAWNQNCNTGADISSRLNLFSTWRGTVHDSNSHWTLLTNCNSGSAVGLAWLGQACMQSAETAPGGPNGANETTTGANIVAKTSSEWQVIAHETGHTFGAVHDCDTQTCADQQAVSAQQCCPLSAQTCDAGEKYIMNPFTTKGIMNFSPCSIGNICSAIGRNAVNTTCLSSNKNIATITGQQCGNGIVEDGEDCDCGGPESCGDDPCCDATTCKFKGNAVCDDANEECCNNCQFAPASHVCRPSTGQCDPQETCSGNSSTCPEDVTAPDGQSCSLPNNATTAHVGDLQCASGQCTSRDLQCRTVMGAYTGNNDTYACDDNTCTMSCASPSFGPGTCYGLQQNLLDGTPCGGGGKCSNGRCMGSSVGKEVGNWISNHKPVVIGIASAIGGILLFAILSSIWSRIRRRRNLKNLPKGPDGQPMTMGPPGYPPNAFTGPPPSGGYYGGGGWQQNSQAWNQQGNNIPMPPPSYAQPTNMSGGLSGSPQPPQHGVPFDRQMDAGWRPPPGPPPGMQTMRYA
ncbi:MAG: hypothetical protein Q9162_000562 [Coniocarpon cinnabarinum]